MDSTIERLTSSSAGSRAVQRLIRRFESSGFSQAIANRWVNCSGVQLIRRSRSICVHETVYDRNVPLGQCRETFSASIEPYQR